MSILRQEDPVTNPPKERSLDFRIFKDLDIPEMSIAAGKLVLAEGSSGSAMYIIRNGSVAVKVNGVTVEEIGEGGISLDDDYRKAEAILRDISIQGPAPAPSADLKLAGE